MFGVQPALPMAIGSSHGPPNGSGAPTDRLCDFQKNQFQSAILKSDRLLAAEITRITNWRISGPARSLLLTIKALSGDQACRHPSPGSRLSQCRPEPSGLTRPVPVPRAPEKLSHAPSGDHCGACGSISGTAITSTDSTV